MAAALVVVALPAATGAPAVAQDYDIVVTTAAEDVAPDDPACPHETRCTLRHAIETANADPGDDPLSIGFDPEVFPLGEPATITIEVGVLPALERPDATIDARESGVILDGYALEPGGDVVGLVLSGGGTSVRGLTIRGFSAACITLAGDDATAGGRAADGSRNRLDDCGTGIFTSGEGARVDGNLIGLDPADPEAPAMTAGIVVAASDVLVGHADPFPGPASIVGNVATGIRVGLGSGGAITGVVVDSNLVGADEDLEPAPVETGILIDHPSSGTLVGENEVRNAGTGIAVADDNNGMSSHGNELRGNRFFALSGLAIDLRADGVRNLSDPNDVDEGPNTMLNSPAFTRVTQAQVSGTACPGCWVDLYVAAHVPGGDQDHAETPVLNGSITAGPAGNFTFNSPAISPGTWLMAMTTDGDGNSSEFSPAERVGAGAVQCGNQALVPGWNFAGYFGQPMALGDDFPGPAVRAVHRLGNGTTNYLSWFTSGSIGLGSLSTGEPYWFYADAAMPLPGGFSLTSALPVELEAGWNDFVYVGASADVEDAFASIDGQWDALYRYQNDGQRERWLSYGSPDVPDYVHAFDNAVPCVAYRIHMTSPGTLEPLQP